jgi:hypothetical protein
MIRIATNARNLKAKSDLGLLVVDDMQLVEADNAVLTGRKKAPAFPGA